MRFCILPIIGALILIPANMISNSSTFTYDVIILDCEETHMENILDLKKNTAINISVLITLITLLIMVVSNRLSNVS